MDPTQRIDPNKTLLTHMQSMQDPLKTQAMGALDVNKTSMMTGIAPGGRALNVEIISGRKATMANGPAREQFLLELHAGTAGAGGVRTPMNLGLVIDRSGSMEGPPLDYVKQACMQLVDMLSPDDVLSIVTFEQMVDVLMPPQRVSNKQMIKEGISHILAGNTTNLHEGMRVGFSQVIAGEQPGRATRMVVLTDGD